MPIYQTTTFKGGPGGAYDYSRSGNPTRKFLEHHIAKISGGKHAFAVSSGMSAMDVIFRLLQPGEEVIAGNDLYGGSNRLLTYLKNNNGVVVHHIPTTSIDAFVPLLKKPDSKVRFVLLESPTNPLLQIADLKGIINLVHECIPQAIVIVDNTMMSPLLARPLDIGADIIYDSATKFLSGHHDLMAGTIACNRDDLAQVCLASWPLLITLLNKLCSAAHLLCYQHHRQWSLSIRLVLAPPRYQNSGFKDERPAGQLATHR